MHHFKGVFPEIGDQWPGRRFTHCGGDVPRLHRESHLSVLPAHCVEIAVCVKVDDLVAGSFVDLAVELGDLVLARTIVAGSNAVSSTIPSQVPSLLDSGKFALLRVMQSDLKLKYGFTYRRDRMLSPAAELFMKLVRELEISLEAENRQLFDAIWWRDSDSGIACKTREKGQR